MNEDLTRGQSHEGMGCQPQPQHTGPFEKPHASACWREADRQMETSETWELFGEKKLISKQEAYRPWEDKKISQN